MSIYYVNVDIHKVQNNKLYNPISHLSGIDHIYSITRIMLLESLRICVFTCYILDTL